MILSFSYDIIISMFPMKVKFWMKECEMDLIEGRNFRKKLLELVLPIAFRQFMLALVSASDAIMLGFVDQTLLSAVSLAGQVQFVFNLFMLALTIGASMFAAQFWGKGDRETVEKILAFVLRASLAVSAVFLSRQLRGLNFSCGPSHRMRR